MYWQKIDLRCNFIKNDFDQKGASIEISRHVCLIISFTRLDN